MTLEEMRAYENPIEHRDPGYADRAAEYGRDVFRPEMEKRLPDIDIATCEDLRLESGCCPACHGYYLHFDMKVVVDLPGGRTGWICCAVHRALFPDSAITDYDPELLEFRRVFYPNDARSQGA